MMFRLFYCLGLFVFTGFFVVCNHTFINFSEFSFLMTRTYSLLDKSAKKHYSFFSQKTGVKPTSHLTLRNLPSLSSHSLADLLNPFAQMSASYIDVFDCDTLHLHKSDTHSFYSVSRKKKVHLAQKQKISTLTHIQRLGVLSNILSGKITYDQIAYDSGTFRYQARYAQSCVDANRPITANDILRLSYDDIYTRLHTKKMESRSRFYL
jgi:hypothetical protein